MGNTSPQIATEKYKPKNSQFPIRIKNPYQYARSKMWENLVNPEGEPANRERKTKKRETN
jgi:hypothetical protein